MSKQTEKLKKEIASMEAVYAKPSTSEGTKKILKRSIETAKAKLEKQEELAKKLKTAMYGPKKEEPKKEEPKKEEPAKPKGAKKPSTPLSKLMRRVKGKGYEPYRGKKVDLERDGGRKAKAPGKKVSKNGRTYWESRPNRIDVKQKAKKAPYLKDGGEVPNIAYGDMVYNTLESALSSIKSLVNPQNFTMMKKDGKYMLTTNRRSGIFSKAGWENFGHVLSNNTLYRGTIGKLEFGGVAGYDEGGEMEYDSYDEAKFNMDKFMVEDADFEEFHSIQASGDADQMAMFIEENLWSEDKMYQYFPKDGSIKGFAEYLVKEKEKGGYMNNGGDVYLNLSDDERMEIKNLRGLIEETIESIELHKKLAEKSDNKESKRYHESRVMDLKQVLEKRKGRLARLTSRRMEQGGETKNGGGASSLSVKFMKWYVDWSKGVDKDVHVSMSIPNEFSSPVKDDNGKVIILDVIEKKGDVDAKKYMNEILKKADDFGVSIYLQPIPRTHNLKSEEHKKKITKDYLIKYYGKFGFEKTDGGFMVREPKMASGGYMAKGGAVEHGLMVGDKILIVKGPILGILNEETGEAVTVNIETGDRRGSMLEKGGKTEDSYYAAGGPIMKEYEKVEGTDYELKIQVYYDKGGMNYFTSRPEQRGYYVSVSPVQVERRGNGIMVESYAAFSGVKMLVLPVQRQSPKAEAEAREKAMQVLPELKDAIKERIKSKMQ